MFKNFGNAQNVLPPAKNSFTPSHIYLPSKYNTTSFCYIIYFIKILDNILSKY